MGIDFACSSALLALSAVLGGAYGGRVLARGAAHFARVDREGSSALAPKGAMQMFYWGIRPIGEAFARWGIGASAITWASLVLGVAAGVALGAGHLGVAAALVTVSAAGDALDGFVARFTHTASEAGEVLDASVDRYVELAFLGGAAFYLREAPVQLVVCIAALGASFMVSYSTAKAEALRVDPPRGSMRRTERAILMTSGAGLSPIVFALYPAWGAAPLVTALTLIAVAGNVSAVRRLAAVADAVRARAAR